MPNNSPKFAQLYIYDTENEVQNKLAQNPQVLSFNKLHITLHFLRTLHNNLYLQPFLMHLEKYSGTKIFLMKILLLE